MTIPDGQHAGLPYHLQLLSDPWRLAAWRQALIAHVRPGDVVLDVGSGLGLQAVLAARAGAARVIAVESADVAPLLRQIVADNGVDDIVEVHHADLATLAPEPVDLIMGSFVGRLLPDGIMRRAFAATRAWAHADTRYLPGSVRLYAAPVREGPVPALDRWEHPLMGVDLTAVQPASHRVPWTVHLTPSSLVGPVVEIGRYAPPDLPEQLEVESILTVGVDCRLRGVAVWFAADFGEGVVLETGPGRLTFWGQSLWACDEVEVSAGDELGLTGSIRSEPTDVHMEWTITSSSGTPATPRPPTADPSLHLEAGRPRLALPELLADGVVADRSTLGDLITALFQVGDPAGHALLATYERHFGPHPVYRRG